MAKILFLFCFGCYFSATDLLSQTLPWVQDDRSESEWYSELKLRYPDSFSSFESNPETWEKWLSASKILNSKFEKVWNQELRQRYTQQDTSAFFMNFMAYGSLTGASKPMYTKYIRGTGYGGAWAKLGKYTVFSSIFQIDNDVSIDNDYRGRTLNVVNNEQVKGFLIHKHAYISFKMGWFEAMGGKNKIGWGPTSTSSLILSHSAPPLDLIWFRYTAGSFRVTHFFSQMDYSIFSKKDNPSLLSDTEIQRNLAGVRIEARVTNNLTAGLSQTILFPTRSPGFRIVYLNPLVTYFGERENIGLSALDDNINYSADLSFRIPGLHSYASLLIDDFSLDGTVNNKLGFQIGTELSGPVFSFPASFLIEITKINPKVYTVKNTGGPLWLNYVFYGKMLSITQPDFSNGSILGHPLGPDAWQIYTRLKYWDFYPFRMDAAFLYRVFGKENTLIAQGSPFERDESHAFYEIKTGYEWTGWMVTSLFVQNRTQINSRHFRQNTSDWLIGGRFEMDLGYTYRSGKTLF